MVKKTEEEIMRSWEKTLQENPMVSIVCTTYNHEKYIARCLDGFLMQKTSFPFEILIHDDASTDKTKEIILEYKRRYPNIIKTFFEDTNQWSKHNGVIDRFVLLGQKGKYIARCEGDDFWCLETKLQKQYEFLEEHDEYVAVGHRTYSIDSKGKIIETFINNKSGDYVIQDNEKWQLFSHISSYFHRNIFMNMSDKEVERYISIEAPGDRKLPVLFFRYGKLYVLPFYASVYRYQSGPDSFTSQKSNSNIYKIYKEMYSLGVYASEHQMSICYESQMRRLLGGSYWKFLLNEDKSSFVKIENLRKNKFRDFVYCTFYVFWAAAKSILKK